MPVLHRSQQSREVVPAGNSSTYKCSGYVFWPSRPWYTVETYRDALTVFRRYVTYTLHLSIRSFGFEDCTHDLLLSYMEFLNKNGNAETTCNNRLAAIRAYLWYVADDDISLQSVALTASHVPFLKVPKLTREVISEEDLKALLSAPPNTKIGRRDQMILILLYDSAIRVSELL